MAYIKILSSRTVRVSVAEPREYPPDGIINVNADSVHS